LKIIKLSAIDSTNSFLKELAQNSVLNNYTIAVTDEQNSGRGQMNSSWHSEPFKNLTFSIFTRFENLKIAQQSYLNFVISLAVFDCLASMSVPDLTIKWPNDIMSGNKKICGILVETTFKNQEIKNAVIGIGLNVNQEKFPSHIYNASSLKKILKKEFNLDEIMQDLKKRIQVRVLQLEKGSFTTIYDDYLNNLYKKDQPTAFKNEETKSFFMGMIKGVSPQGNLQVQLEDDSIVEFGIKEISLAKV
tara:strand:- start:87698 stop:88438 length:741 start_codon:yes stop_codon:yes gene_type:complete